MRAWRWRHGSSASSRRACSSTAGRGGESDSEVTFELEREGDKTRLVLTHRRLPNRGEMVDVAGGWHTHLVVLEDILAGRRPRPFWSNHARNEADYEGRIDA